MKAAGLIYGPQAHYLDHLAPICHLLEIPLIVTEERLQVCAQKFYPRLKVKLLDYIHAPEQIVKNFDLIFYSMPRPLFDEVFFFAQQFMRKKLHTIWCPHGNSDKGRHSVFMEALKEEEAALVYGKRIIDFLIEKGAFNQLKGYVITGNYRDAFYRKEKAFFDSLINFKPGVRNILYAPTWQDYEKSSSFFAACPILLKELPKNHTLIIKLHPNLVLENEIEVQNLIWKYEGKENIHFLIDFPPVYPILDFVDLYIGDTSSIGYDFLTFNKPMFFLNQNQLGSYLYRCGIVIDPPDYEEIYSIIEKNIELDFSKARKEVYEETFGKEKSLDLVKQEILKLYELFSNDLSFL